MSITIEDYERAVEGFVADMRRPGNNIVSILLYGSVARGNILPGKSDLIDSFVILEPNIFEDKESFLAALTLMAEACARLSKTGIPFHPFHYYSLDEIGRTPAVFLAHLTEECAKVILGENLWPKLNSSVMSRSLARKTFFEMRRLCHPLAAFLNKKMPTNQEHNVILKGLITIKKYIPEAATLALGIGEDPSRVPQAIKNVLPQIDISILKTINELRALPAEDIERERLLEALREALLFVENLHDEILATMK